MEYAPFTMSEGTVQCKTEYLTKFDASSSAYSTMEVLEMDFLFTLPIHWGKSSKRIAVTVFGNGTVNVPKSL